MRFRTLRCGLGFRGELFAFDTDPVIPNRDTIVNKQWNNLAPRIGFAWDPTGRQKWSVRGGFGLGQQVVVEPRPGAGGTIAAQAVAGEGVNVERAFTGRSNLFAAQAGVLNMTRALALEWAKTGITVNAIGAGWTEGMGIIGSAENKQQLERYLPYRRLARPEEIAGAAVYLAADVASYLTGQVIWMEGGALSHV